MFIDVMDPTDFLASPPVRPHPRLEVMTHAQAFPTPGTPQWWELSAAERDAGSFADYREQVPTDAEYALMLQTPGGSDDDAPVTL